MCRFFLIPSSQGSLDKNLGCELAPKLLVEGINKDVEDVTVVESNITETNRELEKAADKAIKEDLKAVFLGGDHSVSFPIVKAYSESFKDLGVIVFDAHADCSNSFMPPSHEDWVRTLIEERFVDEKNFFLLGLRKIFDVEKAFLKERKIKLRTTKEIKKDKNRIVKELKEFQEKFSALYVSIDIDVLDASIASGTGYPEKNGLTLEELFELFNSIAFSKVKALDLVEVNPKKDQNGKTIKAGREILEKAIKLWR